MTGTAAEEAAKQAVQEEVDSRSIFVGNVHYDCQPEDLAEFFKVRRHMRVYSIHYRHMC